MTSETSSSSYPSAARLADSMCYPQYTASLKCLEVFREDKSKCQEHFDTYKECKKKEVFNPFAHPSYLWFMYLFCYIEV
ncbi:uncharacterized protein LOC131165711 isoform X1 [Malania oleifera]|uniref:uncharacterized protein LOC131165711 isoform X1 n=1 Tax=Malania oleifera TaxID=397392 RepID=UPI0025ADD11C|nr:uncharacterized protein LOC131165711 isoform X1 [Malania oleifera]